MSTSTDDQPEITLNQMTPKRPLDVLEVIGGHGPWQFRLWLTFLAATFCNSVVLFSVLFLPSQSFCYLSNSTANLSQINSSTPSEQSSFVGDGVASHIPRNCTSLNCTTQNNSSESTEAASKLFYHTECINSQMENIAKCIYVTACAMSIPFVYFFTKRFGRRSVSLMSCLFLLISVVAVSFTEAVQAFLAFRFIISLMVFNVYLISAYSLMEYVHKYFKTLYFLTGHIGWGLAHFFLPFVSWLTRDWLPFNLAIGIASMFLFLLVWLSPESPSSIPTGGSQLDRSRKALKYAAFTNGYSITDVDLLPHSCNLRHEDTDELQTPVSTRQKVIVSLFSCAFFCLIFTTTFIYFSTKWNTEWFKVKNSRLSFSFIGTIEIAAAIILLFATCLISTKHLWACTSTMTSIIMILIYSRDKPSSATSSAKLFTIGVFSAAAGWTLLLIRTFCHKSTSTLSKRNLLLTAVAVTTGAWAASFVVLNASNQDLLLVFAVLHLVLGIFSAFLPDNFFGVIE